MPLNDTFIRSVKPEARPRKYFDGGGLFLFVPTSGSKLWRLAYRYAGKSKLLSLGAYPTVSLRDARERREDAKRLLARNIDPAEHKREEHRAVIAAQRNSFRNVALDWYAARLADYTERHRATVMYRLNTYIFPAIGKMNIAKLETQDLMDVIMPVEQRGQAATARRLLLIMNHVFRYAIVSGRARHNIAADLRGVLRPHRTRHLAALLETPQVAKLMRDIENFQGYFPVRCALKLHPLVFTRPTELRAAQWQEVDFEAREWRIPAERMKMRRPHIVPLSTQAMDILAQLRAFTGDSPCLFPSPRNPTKSIRDMTMLKALRRMGYQKGEMTLHGFRSIASTLLNELGYNRDWIERQLAHSEHNDVRAAYNHAEYLPERRKMMQEWSDYLYRLRDTVAEQPQGEGQ